MIKIRRLCSAARVGGAAASTTATASSAPANLPLFDILTFLPPNASGRSALFSRALGS